MDTHAAAGGALPSMLVDDSGAGDNGGQSPAKSRKACINCRRQKMKCRVDRGTSCRRCLRAGVPCIFVPRANAASYNDGVLLASLAQPREDSQAFSTNVLRRLKRLEDHLQLGDIDLPMQHHHPHHPHHPHHHLARVDKTAAPQRLSSEPRDATLVPLWPALQVLEKTCSANVDTRVWDEGLIKRLWMTFHDTMLGLHFLPSKQTFSSPTPLLLAAMLYCSSLRGSADVASLAAQYFVVLCNAISQLCMPSSLIGQHPEDPARAEEWAFQTVLGIILAGLLREGVSKETGIWISMAYRLLLEHCPLNMSERSLEWQRLMTGLQIVDLEHASIHLSCPVIPIVAPFDKLRISPQDQLYRLSQMMNTGLTHFTGRGLPTIWSYFTNESPYNMDSSVTYTGVDAAVIRDWARQLDDWLVEFGAQNSDPEGEGKLAFRQYVLHRILVLSIYLPARGSDLLSSTTPKEQHELLVSARAAVRLHLADHSIWANFDLVIITWAALIVIQGVEGGFGEEDDLEVVNIHLQKLREINVQESTLQDLLATRLEARLEALTTPAMITEDLAAEAVFDSSWAIFNQASLQNGYDMFAFSTPTS